MGILHRPVITASAVAVAYIYTDLNQKILPNSQPLPNSYSLSIPNISDLKLANLSFLTRLRIPIPNINYQIHKTSHVSLLDSTYSSVSASPFLHNLYQSADLTKALKRTSCSSNGTSFSSSSSSDVLYRWHLPHPNAVDVPGKPDCSSEKSRTVVVLLGWLGAKQKHLNRYADWFTSRGFHVITFTYPMAEILSYKVGGKAEQHIELLASHLADWLEGEEEKNLVFHTFSNTGWLTYGAILEKFQKKDHTLLGRIRGCIVDSAPVASPDPQVWASGFCAAFLKKQSVATKAYTITNEPGLCITSVNNAVVEAKPAITETVLLLVLEKFFDIVLKLPAVDRRLNDVVDQLKCGQPMCPQLYIYSNADKVIPAVSVESFIKEQQRSGRKVRACNFVYSPHVDHFRHDPKLYGAQLTHFLEDCVLTCCKTS